MVASNAAVGLLPAQPPKIPLQAIHRAGHLRAQLYNEELQGLLAEGGLVLDDRTAIDVIGQASSGAS